MILLGAFLLSATVFSVFNKVGDFLVWRYYLDEESKSERIEGHIKSFQDYVDENKLSVDDSKMISAWSGGNYVDIIIYKDADLIYAPDWFVDFEADNEKETGEESGLESGEVTETGELESDTEYEAVTDEMNETADADGVVGMESDIGTGEGSIEETTGIETERENGWLSGYRGFEQYLTQEAREAYNERLGDILSGNRELTPVYFSDGTLLVTVVDYSEEFMSNLIFAISIIMAMVLFLVVMLISFSSTVTRINKLANNVKRVERGELNIPLKLEGHDEIASLAGDVNSMRNSVVDNMTKEQKAWEANTELITAMSHDIRTPLTVMLGYLDLLELQNIDDISSEYVSACKENALRLKQLSDDMFSYFLVFGKKELKIDLSRGYTAESVMHMIAERIFWIEEKSFETEVVSDFGNASVLVDAIYFNRVLDNLFSNIEKYADNSEKIYVNSSVEDGYLVISFKNLIRTDEIRAESNGIGTKTCRRIMEKMGGEFASVNEDGYYTAKIKIPLEG